MQQGLLQQAEAVWQAQHDRLASELALAQQSGARASVDLQSQRSAAVVALQVPF